MEKQCSVMRTQWYIYKITCTENGKCYIGQTSNPQHRFYRCHYKSNEKMLADIERYGIDSFTAEIIARTEDRQLAQTLERHFVDRFDSIANGYNRFRSFKTAAGCKRTPEANAKRRAAISRLVWMHEPKSGRSTRVSIDASRDLRTQGWLPGRVGNRYLKQSPENKMFKVTIPEGTGDYFKPNK